MEKLASAFPDQLANLLENLPLAMRLEIEGNQCSAVSACK